MIKQGFFKINSNSLKVLHLESIRTGLYQIAGMFFISVYSQILLGIISDISIGRSLFHVFPIFFNSPINWILGNIIPAAAIIFAQRFPPAPVVTFHSITQSVHWQCGKSILDIPFQNITFSPVRMPSKSGISNVFVMVTAYSNTLFFVNEKPSGEPGARYKKDLCLYKAGSQDDAEKSIEIIRKFMSGRLDDEDSFRL